MPRVQEVLPRPPPPPAPPVVSLRSVVPPPPPPPPPSVPNSATTHDTTDAHSALMRQIREQGRQHACTVSTYTPEASGRDYGRVCVTRTRGAVAERRILSELRSSANGTHNSAGIGKWAAAGAALRALRFFMPTDSDVQAILEEAESAVTQQDNLHRKSFRESATDGELQQYEPSITTTVQEFPSQQAFEAMRSRTEALLQQRQTEQAPPSIAQQYEAASPPPPPPPSTEPASARTGVVRPVSGDVWRVYVSPVRPLAFGGGCIESPDEIANTTDAEHLLLRGPRNPVSSSPPPAGAQPQPQPQTTEPASAGFMRQPPPPPALVMRGCGDEPQHYADWAALLKEWLVKDSRVQSAAIIGRDASLWACSEDIRVRPSEADRLVRGMEVQEAINRPIDAYLRFGGESLRCATDLLADAGICAEAVVELGPDAALAPSPPCNTEGGMLVFVTLPNVEGTYPIEVSVGATVGDLAALAHQQMWMQDIESNIAPARNFFPSDHAYDLRFGHPVRFADVGYMCLRYEADEGVCYARGRPPLGQQGMCIVKTGRAVVVATYGDKAGTDAGNCNCAAEDFAEKLKDAGF